MRKTPTEEFARHLDQGVTDKVRRASILKTEDRKAAMKRAFAVPEAARDEAARIKDEILENLETHLLAFSVKATENGIHIHPAATAQEARDIILDLCRRHPGGVVKGKSMATEEIHLNRALEEAGIEVTETDLGEYVVQIDGDTPSHIVTPIIHKDRVEVANSFLREGLGPYTEDPAALALQARHRLREKFQEATVGISGVNFAIVDSGRLVIIENEGNNRLSTTAPNIHIAVMGIEKLLPSESDLPLFLPLLAGSATGQRVTVYTHFIAGPRAADELDGPREVHLILLDAGRRKILQSRYRAILRCIRCGACLNVCPVYRQVSGHGYGHVYPGPLGAVLAPLLERANGGFSLKQLPKASTLCGSCEEVCPVKIPIPDMLLHLRDDAGDKGSWEGFAMVAADRKKWSFAKGAARLGPAPGWTEFREAPAKEGRKFRDWWASRSSTERFARSLPTAGPEVESHVAPVESTPLWDQFERALTALGGEVVHGHSLPDMLATLEIDPGAAWIDPDLTSDLKAKPNPDQSIWDAPVGITRADLAIAETGTLVIRNVPNRARLASLVPPIHVAVIRREDIVATLQEAIRPGNRTDVWITGPSRTADIEGVLVRGVHGPGRLVVLVISGKVNSQ